MSRLEEVEGGNSPYWWDDKPLLRKFDELYKSNEIFLPEDVVERIRWIAVLCVAISIEEGFSYGNVLIPADMNNDTVVRDTDEIYGQDVTDAILEMRAQLRANGWESML